MTLSTEIRARRVAPRRAARTPVLLAMAVALALPGCSTIKGWFSSDDKDATAPAELTDITPTIEIRELWSQSIGDGEERLGLRQHPAVVDGAVYAADLEGRVRALDAQTGKEIWEIETEYQLSGGPGAGEGVVVVGGLNGDIVALDAATGSQRWHATTTSEVITAPAVAGGLAIVRSNDGRTSAYDLANGERRWTFDQQQLPSLTVRGNAEPVVANGIVYLGDAGGTVTALDLRTGLRRWEQVVAQPEGRTDLERMADVDGELAVSGSLLYAISFKGQALAMSSDSGAPLWNRDIGSYAGMAVTEQRVLAVDTHGTAWSLDRFGGSAMWRQEALARRWLTTPAIQGNYMVVGDYDGYLHWIDLDSGEIAARERLQGSAIRATPQVGADGTLYAISTDGKLAAYRID